MQKPENSVRRRLMLEDLERSGIHEKYVQKLGLRLLTRDETENFMGDDTFDVPTYMLPYFNHLGKMINYARLKNLEEGRNFGPKKVKQPFKYLQKPNSPPHLYIPPVYRWPIVDGKIKVRRLIITEGEKKAIKACLVRLPCVALGGVDSFRSRKRGIQLLPEFDYFDLTGCQLELCFDSDVVSNDRVRNALNALAAELSKLGPSSISIVTIDGEVSDKLGLDDFLAQFATRKEARRAYNKLPRRGEPRLVAINGFNSEICYVRSFGKMFNIQNQRAYMSDAQLVTEFGPRARVPDPSDDKKQIPAIKYWLEYRNPADTEVKDTVFEPELPVKFKENPTDPYPVLNLWRPRILLPQHGRVEGWLDLVHFVMGSDIVTRWFLQWLAYPLQNPRTKLLQAVFVWSRTQGVGKNFIVEPFIEQIYGDYYGKVGPQTLDSGFNDWLKHKLFIFGEEVFLSTKRDRETTMGALKGAITSEMVTINAKYQPSMKYKNYSQLYLTSNSSNALALADHDRRFLVVHAPEKKKKDSYYSDLDRWARKEHGAQKVLRYLLEKVDCTGFNPKGAAPETEDKREVIENSFDTIDWYVNEIQNEPRKFFTTENGISSEQDIFSTMEIQHAINVYAKNNGMNGATSPTALGRALGSIPEKWRRKLYVGTNVRKNPTYRLLICLFHRDHWEQMSDSDWRDYYRKYHAKLKDLSRDPREENVIIKKEENT